MAGRHLDHTRPRKRGGERIDNVTQERRRSGPSREQHRPVKFRTREISSECVKRAGVLRSELRNPIHSSHCGSCRALPPGGTKPARLRKASKVSSVTSAAGSGTSFSRRATSSWARPWSGSTQSAGGSIRTTDRTRSECPRRNPGSPVHRRTMRSGRPVRSAPANRAWP